MTPTRTRRGLVAAGNDAGESMSKTPSPVIGRRAGGRDIPQSHQPSRLANHSDFIFSIEYDLFLKNLVGFDQASCLSTSSSPPSGAGYYHRSNCKGELLHSASFSPQPLPKMLTGNNCSQSSSVVLPYHQQYYHQQFKHASHSLSSSASSSTSSPTRRPVVQQQADNALNKNKNDKVTDVEIDEIEPESLSHQHLHALHRFRRQRAKGKHGNCLKYT